MRAGARGRRRSHLTLVGLLLAASLALAAQAGAAFDCGASIAGCEVHIDNSGRAWFSTHEKLTEDALGDGTRRGGVWQIYRRDGDTTTLLKGPTGEPIPADEHRGTARIAGLSPDGERLYISTSAALSPQDTDAGRDHSAFDGYEVSGGSYRLLTTGPLDEPVAGLFGPDGARVVWASDDGRHAYFITKRRMTADDLDGAIDVYVRSGETTRLVSTGPAAAASDANRPYEAKFLGASTDGATAFFSTMEPLTADDTGEDTFDIYAWRDGIARRITRTTAGPGAPSEGFNEASFSGAATDGSLFFVAFSQQSPDDTDPYEDLYAARPDGTIQRLTATPPGPPLTTAAQRFLRGGAASHDGSRVFFMTMRSLLPEDRNSALDIYMWEASTGGLRLISPDTGSSREGWDGELHLTAISRDGRRAYFTTWERLAAGDTDDKIDVYEWRDGAIRLVSPASDGRQHYAVFKGISPNGRYVAFSTLEPLLSADADSESDIYLVDMRAAGGAAASASRRKKPRRRRTRRLRLVTAEAIPPRMRVARRGSFRRRGARLRLRCPKSERTGPCRGRVRLLHRRTRRLLAVGRFRIAAGRRAAVRLRGRRLPGRRRAPLPALARVRGADRLGNAAVVRRKVVLRRAPERKRRARR